MLPRPFQFPVYMGQLHTCSYTLKGFGEGLVFNSLFFFFLFFFTILSQVCSLSHLSICHFPSTFPLMHLLKKKKFPNSPCYQERHCKRGESELEKL